MGEGLACGRFGGRPPSFAGHDSAGDEARLISGYSAVQPRGGQPDPLRSARWSKLSYKQPQARFNPEGEDARRPRPTGRAPDF